MKKLLFSGIASAIFAVNAMSIVTTDELPSQSAYYTSWGQDGTSAQTFISEANKKSTFKEAGNRIDSLYLSFLRWDGLGNIKDDDGIFYTPDSWKSNAYKDIRTMQTAVKDNSVPGKKTKFIATFGGWTYSGMWDTILDDATREVLARNIVALMGNKLGKYWNGYRDIEGLNIDGIDFDFERQVRISPELNDAFVKLVERIREIQTDSSILTEIGVKTEDVQNDLIMLTTYHVGADPVECGSNTNLGPNDGCSFVDKSRSSHHGEIVRLLEKIQGKDLFDGYNIMLYDAGRTKEFHPEVAINNYLKYLPASRVNGGITIKEQWGPNGRFVQDVEVNKSFIKLFKEKSLNGYFTWSIGGIPATPSADILSHYNLAQVWENTIDAKDYIPESFEISGIMSSPKTKSVLGRDHSIVKKDGKNYVVIGGTWYNTGNEETIIPPTIEIEEFSYNLWPGYASQNKVNYLCKNGTNNLKTADLIKDKKYLFVETRNGSWCRSIDLPEASVEMKGKVIDVFRKSSWNTLVNGKGIPYWKVVRYTYK